MGIPYSRAYTAVKKFGIQIPKRNGYIYTKEARLNKSISQKAAYKKKYPKGRFGETHPRWNGGRRIINGYISIYAPEHPRAKTSKAVFEHILVAEKTLGRYLESDEIVHHINHEKQDNRPENLMVVTRGQHVTNHFKEGKMAAELTLRIKELEDLLDKHNIKY